jgi:hypothetical protein
MGAEEEPCPLANPETDAATTKDKMTGHFFIKIELFKVDCSGSLIQ